MDNIIAMTTDSKKTELQQWAEIDRRIKLHKEGKSKNYTWEEVKASAKSKTTELKKSKNE